MRRTLARANSRLPTRVTARSLLQTACEQIRNSLTGAPDGSASTPYLDALVLLCHAWGVEKEALLASMADEVPEAVAHRFADGVSQRCAGRPISYIRGRKEFYGREFLVDERVLVPRPETELLVETAIDQISRFDGPIHVHDCCTGSGCIAITIAAEASHCSVSASDISGQALALAVKNATVLLAGTDRVRFFESDLLEAFLRDPGGKQERPTIITANPPYLTTLEYKEISETGWPEPALALESGAFGTDHLWRLTRQAIKVLPIGGRLIVEIGAGQRNSVQELFLSSGFTDFRVVKDLAGRSRVCTGLKPGT